MIHKRSRKLLPLPICGASGPKARTTIPSGTNGGVCTDQGWITAVHVSGLDRFTEWDTEEVYTEEVQDWSRALSPLWSSLCLHGVRQWRKPHQRGKIDAWCQNVSLNLGRHHPMKHTPEAEARKTPQTEDVPTDEQEPAHVIVEEDVVELHVGMEEL